MSRVARARGTGDVDLTFLLRRSEQLAAEASAKKTRVLAGRDALFGVFDVYMMSEARALERANNCAQALQDGCEDPRATILDMLEGYGLGDAELEKCARAAADAWRDALQPPAPKS